MQDHDFDVIAANFPTKRHAIMHKYPHIVPHRGHYCLFFFIMEALLKHKGHYCLYLEQTDHVI